MGWQRVPDTFDDDTPMKVWSREELDAEIKSLNRGIESVDQRGKSGHGTRSYYLNKGCRCEPCRDANRTYKRLSFAQRMRKVAYK